MKKYLSLIGIAVMILFVCLLGYQAFFAYLAEHTYYISMLSSSQNWGVFISALLCALLFPILYVLICNNVKVKNLIIAFILGAGVFGFIHSNIKGDPIGIGHLITVFNTVLLVCLGIYLILGFSAVGSWIEKKLIKFDQFRWQEIFLSFGIGFCSFIIIVQILMGIGILYGIVSWILFLGLGFMIRYERKSLGKWGEIIGNILNTYKVGLTNGEFNLNSKKFWNSQKIGFIALFLPVLLSIAYLYIGIQNSFTPYSTAWDANHEYMYIPKILAENAGVYRGNSIASNMPGFWHQFLTFIFSLTGCTNGWFGLSSDNIAISMNNISAFFVLILGIAVIFQIFSLVNNKKEKVEDDQSELKKGSKSIIESEVKNGNGITMGWYLLLLWLTGGMGAFLVIVDNKTDLGVMALSLLALLAGLIFLQNRKVSKGKKEILKYVLIAGLFFGFAALAKITAFVDFVLFGLLLIGLRFSPLTSLGLGAIVMGLVRKFNILTSSVMLTDANANRFIVVGLVITVIGLVIHLSKRSGRKALSKDFLHLLILGVSFLIPLILLKLPRSAISQIKTDNFSFGNSLKSVFLSINSENHKKINDKLLVQNTIVENASDVNEISDFSGVSTIEEQDFINGSILNSKNNQSFEQCKSAGDIYSDKELNEGLQEINGGQGGEDLGRYIGYGWKEFTDTNLLNVSEDVANKNWFKFFKALWPKSSECEGLSDTNNVVCEKNLAYGIIKLFWPTSDTCYGFNHDAKVLCNNASVIDSFKIDDLRAIYENGINNKKGEAGLLLKAAIEAYDKAKSEGKLGFGVSNDALFHDEIVNLRQYYQSHSIASNEKSVNIPYRYLVPLNISFNWSLQNLSSYYTDIGFFWVIIYLFLLIVLPYAIIKKDNTLTSIALTTIVGWGIWWIIGSAILWYGTVLISWTMISVALFWDRLLQKDNNIKILTKFLIILVGIIFGIQILFNFIRISSQGANSVFVWYKGNVGNVQVIDENLQSSSKSKYGYKRKNIFDLQFPQYNSIINALANRDNDDGIIIAGTYIQYFLGNQWNINFDGMLNGFWRNVSDGDLCKTYWRLKKGKTRYLIIDPNIGTVSMGEGNETLFYRFFGKLTSDKSRIETDGTITTLIRLYKEGYLKLLSTNNLGSKYAFSLDDNVFRNYFGEDLDDEELILLRGKMAIMQYFSDANSMFGALINIFLSRVLNDARAGIEDIANVYGLEIDVNKVANAAYMYLNKQAGEGFAKDLTQDERIVLVAYTNIYLGYKQGGENEVLPMIQNLLSSSVSGGSQIIALELN